MHDSLGEAIARSRGRQPTEKKNNDPKPRQGRQHGIRPVTAAPVGASVNTNSRDRGFHPRLCAVATDVAESQIGPWFWNTSKNGFLQKLALSN